MIFIILTIILRTMIIYLTVLVVMRLMGKREVGQLSAFDLIVAIMIAEVAVFPMEDLNIPLFIGLIPMFVLASMQILIAYLLLHSRTMRKIIEGSPSVLISEGKIMEREMRKQRYNINELLEQLREHDVFDVADVEYAILEASGKLSVIKKPAKRTVIPADMGLHPPGETISTPIVLDGEIIAENLQSIGLTPDWLREKLQHYNLETKDVFFASLSGEGQLYISEKESKKHN